MHDIVWMTHPSQTHSTISTVQTGWRLPHHQISRLGQCISANPFGKPLLNHLSWTAQHAYVNSFYFLWYGSTALAGPHIYSLLAVGNTLHLLLVRKTPRTVSFVAYLKQESIRSSSRNPPSPTSSPTGWSLITWKSASWAARCVCSKRARCRSLRVSSSSPTKRKISRMSTPCCRRSLGFHLSWTCSHHGDDTAKEFE